MKKILVAVPTTGQLPIRTVKSLMGLLFHHIDGVSYHLQMTENSLVYDARNTIATDAMENGFDYVLWIDSDMTFPEDALERLLNHGKDVVTGIYHERRGRHRPVIYKQLNAAGEKETYADYPDDGLFMVAGCGFGMVLTKVSALRDVANDCHLLFHPYYTLGEDLSFCLRWNRIGGQIWCDPLLKCGHLGEYEFTEADYGR